MYNWAMFKPVLLQPVDYLAIGHITCDILPSGRRMGGTVTYAALTARALGLRVGIVTSHGGEVPITELGEIPMINYPAEFSTTFENIQTPAGRKQFIRHLAPALNLNLIPDPWLNAPIVHLAPVAQEVEPSLVRHFPTALIGVTPQGWLRYWDFSGNVSTG